MKQHLSVALLGSILALATSACGTWFKKREHSEASKTLAVNLPVNPMLHQFIDPKAILHCGEESDDLTLESIASLSSDENTKVVEFKTGTAMTEGIFCDIQVVASKASDDFILKYTFNGSDNVFYKTTTGQVRLGLDRFELKVYMYPVFEPRDPEMFNEGELLFVRTPNDGIFKDEEKDDWRIIYYQGETPIASAVKNLSNASKMPSPFLPNPSLFLTFDVNWPQDQKATRVVITNPRGAIYGGNVEYAQTSGEAAKVFSMVKLEQEPPPPPSDILRVEVGECNETIEGCPEE